MIPLLSVALLAGGQAVPVRLDGDVVRVRDVATVAFGADLPILRLPAGVDDVTLAVETLRRLLANRLPGVVARLRVPTPMRFVRGKSARHPARCFRTRRSLQAGSPVAPDDVDTVDCSGRIVALDYDRRMRRAVARQDLPAGTLLKVVRLSSQDVVPAGRSMVLTTRRGVVTVERTVVTLQPARTNTRVFVQAADGAAFSAPIGSASQ